MTFGKIFKEAQQFRELQSGLSELVELSQVQVKDKLKGSGMASSHYYRSLHERKLNAKQLLGVFRSIIEIGNFKIAQNKFNRIDENNINVNT